VSLRPDARAPTGEIAMFESAHHADDGHEAHSAADLLAEAGLDRRAISEVLRGRGDAE